MKNPYTADALQNTDPFSCRTDFSRVKDSRHGFLSFIFLVVLLCCAPCGAQPLRIVAPNGGETLMGGELYTVQWEGGSPLENVLLDYSLDAGAAWHTITDRARGSEYMWTVPSVASSRCLMRARQHTVGPKQWDLIRLDIGLSTIAQQNLSMNRVPVFLPSGDSLALMYFQDTMSIAPGTMLHSDGEDDAVLLCYSPQGALKWWHQLGTEGMNRAELLLTVTPAGTVVVVGTFKDTFLFDRKELFTSKGYEDVFCVALAPDGAVQWAKQIGGVRSDYGGAVTAAGNGDILLGLETYGPLDPGDGNIYTTQGRRDILLVRFGADGTIRWVRQFGEKETGGMEMDVRQLHVRSDGDIAVVGRIDIPEEPTGPNANVHFIATCTADGDSIRWLKHARLQTMRAAFTAGDTCVIAGIYEGGADTFALDDATVVPATGTSANIVIAQYAPDGSVNWVRQCGGPAGELVYTVDMDSRGNAYIGGMYVGELPLGATTLICSTGFEGYVACFSAAGETLWAKPLISDFTSRIEQVYVDSLDNLHVFGRAHHPAEFGDSLRVGESVWLHLAVRDGAVVAVADTSDTFWSIRTPVAAPVVLEVASAAAAVGREVEIPVLLHNAAALAATGVTALELTLEVQNASILYPHDEQHIAFFEIDNNTCRLVLKPVAVTSSEELVHLRFVATLGDDTATTVRVVACEAEGGSLVVSDTIPGRFVLQGVCVEGGVVRLYRAGAGSSISVSPNPATELMEVRAIVGERGYVRLVLQDVLGAEVQSIYEGDIASGELLRTVDVRSLPSGVYYLRLQTPTTTKTVVLNINR